MAHELNQPLTSIASYGDTLSRLKKSNSWETEDMDDALQEITKQAHRAADILQHLRGLVQKDVSMRSGIDINALVQEVIQLTNVEIRSNDIYIHQDMAQSLPEVRGNKILIEQVVMNLIRNAIDAMSSEKCIERQLIIQTQLNEKGEIEVGISDMGPGLSSEMLEGIFKPFYTTKQDGMGMGLSICRSIIEEHDGKLWASSEPDRGTTLKFTIPVSGSVEVKNAN